MQAGSSGKKMLRQTLSATHQNLDDHMDINMEANGANKNGQWGERGNTKLKSKGKQRAVSLEVNIDMHDLNNFGSGEESGNEFPGFKPKSKLRDRHNWDDQIALPRSDGMQPLEE